LTCKIGKSLINQFLSTETVHMALVTHMGTCFRYCYD